MKFIHIFSMHAYIFFPFLIFENPSFFQMLGSTSTYTYRLTISDQSVFTVAQYEDALRLAFANAAGIDVGSVAVTITQNGSDVLITWSTTDSGAASVISDSSFYSSLQSYLLQIPGFNTVINDHNISHFTFEDSYFKIRTK